MYKNIENKYVFTISSEYHTNNIKNIQESVKRCTLKLKVM